MMKVADIMTKEVIKIRNSVKVSEAVRSMRQHNIHTLIVDRNHNQDAYGILTAFDIVSKVTAFGRDPRQVRVYEIMTKPCLVLNPELGVEYAAKLLTTTGFHSAPIIQKNLLGILSISDILDQSDFLDNPLEIELAKRIQQLIADANSVCQQMGVDSKVCKQAWQAVDAVQAEAAHYLTKEIEKTAFETFYEENPEAFKDSEYDTWCSG